MAPPPPPPELSDDVTGEIFLRLPPDEPENLFRASLVCKRWLRLLCDPTFLRSYRSFHGAPPLLGLLQNRQVMEGNPKPRLMPTTAVPLSPNPRFLRALDSRHGRVLLHVTGANGLEPMVWDPITGEEKRVPKENIDWLIYTAAVICPVSGCDHLDCHGGPFIVVFAATDDKDELIKASMYSSETGVWSVPVTLDNSKELTFEEHLLAIRRGERAPYVQPRRGALVGDEMYFTIRKGNAIMKYDWNKNCLSTVNPPSPDKRQMNITLMVMEDGSLGFASMKQDSSLHLWSRKVNTDEVAEWVECRVIELKKILPVDVPSDGACVVGSAEGVSIIFVSTVGGLFAINLKSGRVKKVDEPEVYFSVLPYMSFYTPGLAMLNCLR